MDEQTRISDRNDRAAAAIEDRVQPRTTLMKTVLVAATVLALLSSSALAQSSGPANSSQMDAASASNDQKGPGDAAKDNGQAKESATIEKIRQDLQNAGFSDVKVVARSFVVQAKTSAGDPVVMTIGPHGMSVFEAMTGDGSASGTVGTGAGSAASSGANPDTSTGANAGSPGSERSTPQQ